MAIDIKMPALSPTMEEGTLTKWLVKEGDTVVSGDILAEIETDKATMEVESIDEGVVGKITVEAEEELKIICSNKNSSPLNSVLASKKGNMKISLLLVIAIFLNTSFLLAETLFTFVGNLELWPFLVLEFFLLIGWYAHKTIKDLKKECIIDLGKLNVFVYGKPKDKN